MIAKLNKMVFQLNVIRGEKWNNNCFYKVNELYEGCFGPIFTSIIIHLPYVQHYELYNSSEIMNSPPENENSSAENMNIRLFILFYFIINLFIII